MDKELREAVDNTIEPHLQEFKAGHTGTVADNLVALIKSREERLVAKARYDELTKLGRLYNGRREVYLTHYEERYKYLSDLTKSQEKT